jgi:hypothetical protein
MRELTVAFLGCGISFSMLVCMGDLVFANLIVNTRGLQCTQAAVLRNDLFIIKVDISRSKQLWKTEDSISCTVLETGS